MGGTLFDIVALLYQPFLRSEKRETSERKYCKVEGSKEDKKKRGEKKERESQSISKRGQ